MRKLFAVTMAGFIFLIVNPFALADEPYISNATQNSEIAASDYKYALVVASLVGGAGAAYSFFKEDYGGSLMGLSFAVTPELLLGLNYFGKALDRVIPQEKTYTLDKITKVERVRWSGLSLGGWRVFGSWAESPEEPSLFGAVSPHFRLNNDDKTVFRGLGRESRLAQKFFPTLHSRQNLRAIVSSDELANRSLTKFDAQIATGGKINMVSTGLAVGGDVAMVTGVVMMFAGLGQTTESGETSPMLKNGYVLASAGIAMWTIGKIGQLAGAIVTKQSFSHLGDAMRHYNKAHE